jgi:Domain of unknown function (DUF4160)
MPTVLKFGSVRFAIHIRDEHQPPHVHVYHPDGTVVLILAETTREVRVRNVQGKLTTSDVSRMKTIAEEHFETLIAIWSRYHR